MKNKKAQYSIEFLTIVGVAAVMIGVALMFATSQLKTTTDNQKIAEATSIATKIAETAEQVAYYGSPSLLTLEVRMVDGIKTIELQKRLSAVCTNKCSTIVIALNTGKNITAELSALIFPLDQTNPDIESVPIDYKGYDDSNTIRYNTVPSALSTQGKKTLVFQARKCPSGQSSLTDCTGEYVALSSK